MDPVRVGVIATLALMLLVVFGCLLRVGARPTPSRRGVAIVTADTLSEFMRGSNGIIMIHAPWCGHCAAMLPTFREAPQKSTSDAAWATCDADAHPHVARALGVRGFPTCLRVRDGKVTEYRGDRSLSSLLAFAS